jgi:hypothetical protein
MPSEEETIEVEGYECEDFQPEETDDEFEAKVQEHLDAMRSNLEDERSGKRYLQFAEVFWRHLMKSCDQVRPMRPTTRTFLVLKAA